MVIKDNTPVERHDVDRFRVSVKREDLACEPPGPPFSKMRGVMKHLTKLKEKGVESVGYVETSVSMAGWGVAYGTHVLGLHCVIYDPQYSDDSEQSLDLLSYHRTMWKKWGADTREVPAGRAKINYYRAKKELKGTGTHLLPLGLPFEESIEATSEEFHRYWTTQAKKKPKSIVVNIGSGTICAGIIRYVKDLTEDIPTVYGVMGRTGNVDYRRKVIYKKAYHNQVPPGGLVAKPSLKIVDPGWEYTHRSDYPCPFPCHPYYDRKAWQWLVLNAAQIKHPVLFWNIGREFEENE